VLPVPAESWKRESHIIVVVGGWKKEKKKNFINLSSGYTFCIEAVVDGRRLILLKEIGHGGCHRGRRSSAYPYVIRDKLGCIELSVPEQLQKFLARTGQK
jgi:hypothetical protein